MACHPPVVRPFARYAAIRTNERYFRVMTSDQVTCAYPDCDRPVAPPPPTGGRSSYCARADHNRTT
ncbi:MAG: hypothetical protein JWR62_1014, partial [Modestobacter sp.]|nr:hypothetical protein [Modestobacter sp.]